MYLKESVLVAHALYAYQKWWQTTAHASRGIFEVQTADGLAPILMKRKSKGTTGRALIISCSLKSNDFLCVCFRPGAAACFGWDQM